VTPRTLADVALLVGGTLADTDGTPVVTGVGLDSRSAGPGTLFLALAGERADGHAYARDAVAAGAAGVLAARPVGVPAVVADDVAAALGRLAAAALAALPRVTVVGVTGSAGKTTTKDLLAVLLSRLGPTVAAAGSYNNDLGLPLTVLRCDADTRFLVLEYGARGPGHIARLARIAPPAVAVVLNVGSAHLGEFGSREAIARAKAELLAGDGVAVLNADDPAVAAMSSTRRVVWFGPGPEADYRVERVVPDDAGRPSFLLVPPRGDAVPVALGLVGEHLVPDAVAAAAVAIELGLPPGEAAAGLAAARPASPHRMAVRARSDGVTVIDDSYNANPESVRAALKALVAMGRPAGGRSIAVLGEMRELGDSAGDSHDAVGRLAVRLDVDLLVTVGDAASPVGRLHAAATLEGSWGDEAVHVPDVAAAVAYLTPRVRPGDVVLVKASRAVGLERVADALLAAAGPAA